MMMGALFGSFEGCALWMPYWTVALEVSRLSPATEARGRATTAEAASTNWQRPDRRLRSGWRGFMANLGGGRWIRSAERIGRWNRRGEAVKGPGRYIMKRLIPGIN